MNTYFALAALADLTAVVAHGVIGHRVILTPLTADRLFPTGAFGDAAITRRVLVVTWHIVTATFAAGAIAMVLLASGEVRSEPLALGVAAMHAGFLLVGIACFASRAARLLRPIPITFLTCMITCATMAWLGTR